MASETLPLLTTELFLSVLGYLDVHDIFNLRLTSRSVAYKIGYDPFRPFVKTKRVGITRASLEAFAYVTCEGRIGCLVQDLTLVGVVYDTQSLANTLKGSGKRGSQDSLDPPGGSRPISSSAAIFAKAQSDVEKFGRQQADLDAFRKEKLDVVLLTKALRNLAAARVDLKRFSLEITVHRGGTVTRVSLEQGEWLSLTFPAAAHTFSLAMAALRDSELAIPALDVFGDMPNLTASYVPCDVLSLGWPASKLTSSFLALRTLALRFSDPVLDNPEYDARPLDREQEHAPPRSPEETDRVPDAVSDQLSDESNYSSLAQLLGSCENLEVLNLSGFLPKMTRSNLREMNLKRRRYMYHLSHMKPLRHLRQVSLSGIDVDDADLTTFLEHHHLSLREISLREVHIMRGSIATVLSKLASEDFALDKIELEDLWEGTRLALFSDESGQQYTDAQAFHRRMNSIQRVGAEAKKLILYTPTFRPEWRSPMVWQWSRQRQLEFGRR